MTASPVHAHAQGDPARALAGLLQAVERLSVAPPAALQAYQDACLARRHAHGLRHSRFYRQRLAEADIDPATTPSLRQLYRWPLLTRAQLQSADAQAFCDPGPGHGAVHVTTTSGSSGQPVRVARTGLNHLYWMAHGVREHVWWQRDFSASLLVVRANLSRQLVVQRGWGPPAGLLTPTGTSYAASLDLSSRDIAGLIAEIEPAYVLLYPSLLADLLQHFERQGAVPRGLRQVRTLGETLSDDLRQAVHAAWNVGIADTYSTQEAGVIAIQCPQGEGYHVMADSLVVEILRPDGTACAEGETGQVVVTDLHNAATPLVRYAIGDLAEAGGRCGCGRSLPMLRRVRGRLRNLIAYPDGQRRWPRIGFAHFRAIAPIERYQLVQHALDRLELRLVCAPLEPVQEQALTAVVQRALGHAFPLRLSYHAGGLPRPPGGKFEEVLSLVAP